MLRIAVLFTMILCLVASSGHPDEILSLPGLNFKLNYKQYSGYLNATKGKNLHYWFVESQRNPSKDPVLLWLNGGPGCSSLEGLLAELGPLHVSHDGNTLYNNTYSWNREANVLFLESPAGVGYSYSNNLWDTIDDDTVSLDNYLALQRFFEKFPQFKDNDFYVTGESYGGIYVPTLASRILNGTTKINLKGYAIGNGYLDFGQWINSQNFFSYYHGLVEKELWESILKHCCGGISKRENCSFNHPSIKCMYFTTQVFFIVHNRGINAYNMYADCAHTTNKNSRDLVDRRLFMSYLPKKFHKLGDTISCLDSSNLIKYLNKPEVRKALHIPDFVRKWDICSTHVEVSYKKTHDTVRPEILELAKSGIRGLIYNGDVDIMCNFLGDMWFVEDLGLKVKNNYDIWLYSNQVAGFVKYYDNLTFLTIKGAGHMVPEDKPSQAFYMITKFLNNEMY